MWPFPDESKEKNDAPRRTPQQNQVDELKEWKAVGDTVVYLGKELSVVGHQRWVHGIAIHLIPVLEVEYIDRNGIIRTHELSFEQAQAIMRQERNSNNKLAET